MDYKTLLDRLAQAKAVYGNPASAHTPAATGTWGVQPVTEFKPETKNFQAALYTDSVTGQYRVAYAGSNDNALQTISGGVQLDNALSNGAANASCYLKAA